MIAATAGAIAGGYGGYLISLEAEMERDTELAIAWGLVAVGFLTGPWLVGRVWKPHD